MSVVFTSQDPERLILTLVAEFAASPERVWQLWEDPRRLERWWGPPGYPTVFTRHELTPGGQSRWSMTIPGEPSRHGWWRVDVVDPPHRLEFVNGAAGDDGEPLLDIEPYACTVAIESTADGARMTAVFRFADAAQMRRLAEGMQAGLTAGFAQMDALLPPADRERG